MEIQNTNGKYLIYDDGRVYSKYSNRFLKPSLTNVGYYRCTLQVNNKDATCLIHRLIALHYLPNPNNLQIVDHIDRNRTNNNINNLRWVTQSENCINKPNYGELPHRHISSTKRRENYYWTISIARNNKFIYRKNYNIKKYSLEEVIRFRNEKYIELGIEIDDN